MEEPNEKPVKTVDAKELKKIQDFEKKVNGTIASVGKILSDDEGQKLRALYRDIPFACTQEEFAMLAHGLIKAYPNVAFLLVYKDEIQFQFVLSISDAHSTMGHARERILHEVGRKIIKSVIIKCDASIDLPHCTYFRRALTDNDYVGKIVDDINSIVFTYFKQNGYLPDEEDEEDKFLDFDGL